MLPIRYSGSGAPSIAATHEGATYQREDAGNGDVYVTHNGAWAILARAGAVAAVATTFTGTSPILIDGDNAAHDLSANRTISVASATTGAPGVVQLAGDLAGTATSVSVAKVKATAITTAGGALTTGQSLRVTGVATADWGPLNLANANAITGALPLASIAQGGAGTGQALTWSGSAWTPTTIGTSGIAPGADGQVLITVSGAAAWSAVDLANSASITGAMALSHIAQGGATTGQALIWSGTAWAPSGVVTSARTITATAPITIDGTTSADLSANRTIAITDATTSALGSIKLAADLRGTGLLPTVVALTGIAGVVEMHGTTIQWDSGVLNPTITQAPVSGAPTSMTVQAQGSTGSGGGNLTLGGGDGVSVATAGSVAIINGTGQVALLISPTTIQVSRATISFTPTVSSPTINQLPRTAAGVGTPLLVMGQSCTGSATTGANAIFASGLGNSGLGSAAGKVILSWGNVVDAIVIDPATDTITSEVKSFRWAADVTAPAIYQIEATSGSGQPFTFNGQDGNQTSGNNNGGSVFVNGGAKRGSGVDGNVVLSNGGSTGLTVKPASIDIARTILNFSTDAIINAASAHPIVFQIGGATRAELDPDGVLRVADALSAVSAPGAGIDIYSVGGKPTMFGSNASAVEVQWQNTVVNSAIGGALLPVPPVEYLTVFVGGNFRTIALSR